MELVAGDREHVDVHRLHVDRRVARGLHGVGVEGDALFAAERADLGDGLHRADLVVGEHHRDEAGVGADRGLHVLETDHAVGVHVEQRDLKALLLQLGERVQHGVMLELCGDQVLFALARAGAGGRDDGLVVGLAAAGGEVDLARLGVEAFRDGLARLGDRLLRSLAEGVEAGGVAVVLEQVREHRVEGGAAHTGGGRVVCVNEHGQVPFCIVNEIRSSIFRRSGDRAARRCRDRRSSARRARATSAGSDRRRPARRRRPPP